jgi:putative peptidoglycan lipid II flippase
MLSVMKLIRYLREHTLAGGVTILAITQLAASIAGFFRERMLAGTFSGDLGVVDAYLASFRPSDLIFQACIMSAMGTVLVPVLAGYFAKGDREQMDKVMSGAMMVASLVFGVIAGLMMIFFPWLVPFFHIEFTGRTLELYIQFGRLALFTNLLFVFGNSLGQYLVTIQKYWIYGITPVLYTLGTIFGTVFFTPYVGAFGPMYGTILGAILYVLLRLYGLYRSGGYLSFTFWHPDIAHMGQLMLPRVVAFGAFQVQLLYLDGLASGLPEGSVTINNFARNFQSVLVGVVGIAIAQAVYSIMSQAAAQKNRDRFQYYFRYGIFLCLLLTIPGSIALAFLAPVAAALINLTQVSHVFTVSLAIYCISIPFESLTHLQYRAFYAMKQTLIPALCGVGGGLVAIAVACMYVDSFGVYALAAGFTAGEIVQVCGLAITLPWSQARFMAAQTN